MTLKQETADTDIEGFKGAYRINKDGVVSSLRKQLKPSGSAHYIGFSLRKNGKSVFKHLHRLMAETFIPNPENKPQVNHIDGDKKNNSLENLEWATSSENIKHAYDLGIMPSRMGEVGRGVASYCTKSDKKIKSFVSLRSASRFHNVSVSKVSKNCNKGKPKWSLTNIYFKFI